MRTYETIFILNPELDENRVEEVINNVKNFIESNENKILKIDPWGKRSLGYKVRKYTEGYFVLMVFQSEPNFIKQLRNYYQISIENIIKYMVVRFEGDLEKIISSSEESKNNRKE